MPKKSPTHTSKLIRVARSGVAALEAYEKLVVRLFLFAMLVYELMRALSTR